MRRACTGRCRRGDRRAGGLRRRRVGLLGRQLALHARVLAAAEAARYATYRLESGLLALRKELGLYVNLRPIRLREPLRGISPLKPGRTRKIDLEIVRDNVNPTLVPREAAPARRERREKSA